jgi:hypothetical protein
MNKAYTLRNKVTGELMYDEEGSYFSSGLPPYLCSSKEKLAKILSFIEGKVYISTNEQATLFGRDKQTYISQLEIVEVAWQVVESREVTPW